MNPSEKRLSELASLGWKPSHEQAFLAAERSGGLLARIVEEWPGKYILSGPEGDWSGTASGKLKNQAVSRVQMPCVGDWVHCTDPQPGPDGGQLSRIEWVVPRATEIKRMIPGGEEQLLASNIDFVFIVTSLNQDFNLRRLERYLTIAWESGATPVIVLNKVDLCENWEQLLEEARTIAGTTEIVITSAKKGVGVEALLDTLQPGLTGVFLGSSGVGKSTLVNRLRGEDVQATGAVRDDDAKGRHTTTRRSLVSLPERGMIVDTPGLREIQIRVDEAALTSTFDDVGKLADACRFPDCAHHTEPGCAVRTALEDGTLPPERFESYLKLRKEVAAQTRMRDKRLAANSKKRWRSINKSMRQKRKIDDES